MVIKNCKTIAEYAMRRWMMDHDFADGYFTLEINGNEGFVRDNIGDSIKLVYDSNEKRVHVEV